MTKSNKRILLLIVDDDAVDREMIVDSLRSLNAEIKEAGSAKECLSLLQSEVFDLILLDYRLPECTGLELVPRIREIGVTTPIILVTGMDDMHIDIESIGILDYVPKDQLNSEYLAKAVMRAMIMYKTQVDQRRIEQDYKALYNLAPVGLFRVGVNGQLIRSNECCDQILGINMSAPPNVKMNLVCGQDVWESMISELQKDGIIKNRDVSMNIPNGRTICVQLTVRLSTGQDYLEGCMTDITDVKINNHKLTALKQDLQKRLSE